MSPCIRDVLKHCLWLQKVLYLLLGITFVRPEKSRKIAVLCVFLMHLGTCTVPKGNEETLKEALFGDVGGLFSGHTLGCVLVLPATGRVVLQEWDPEQGTHLAWPFAAPGVVAGCRLECTFSLRVVLEFACFVALETEECGMLSPWPEIVSCTLWPERCTPPLVPSQAGWCWRDGVWGDDLLSQVLVWLLPMICSLSAPLPLHDGVGLQGSNCSWFTSPVAFWWLCHFVWALLLSAVCPGCQDSVAE